MFSLLGLQLGHAGRPGERGDRRRHGSRRAFSFQAVSQAQTRSSFPSSDARSCREWAVNVGANANYRRPATPAWTRRLDFWFPAPLCGAASSLRWWWWRSSKPSSASASRCPTCFQYLLTLAGTWLGNLLPDGLLRSLVVNGVWKGAGRCWCFCRRFLLLFLVIGILEDSGYLARAAVIADRLMAG